VGVFLSGLEQVGDHFTYVPAHVDRGSFPAEDHSASEGERPSDEFNRQHVLPSDGPYFVECAFYLVNAAAPGLGSNLSDQQEGEKYLINNVYVASMARFAMERVAELREYFEIRQIDQRPKEKEG